MTDIGVLVRLANPIPDDSRVLTDDELGAVLLLATQRSTEMDMKEMTAPVAPEDRPKRGWMVALAAAAVVILVGTVVLLLSRSSDGVAPATTPSTTLDASPTTTEAPTSTLAASPTTAAFVEPPLDEQATAFFGLLERALTQGDHASASEMVTRATEFIGEPGIPNDQRARFTTKYAMWAELESTVTIDDCSTNTSGLTSCTLSRTSKREPILDLPQRSTVRIKLVDGELRYFEQSPVLSDPYWLERGRLEDWLAQYHPDAYRDGYFSPVDGAQAADLREEYEQLWIDSGRP